jgi:hypothetical protein
MNENQETFYCHSAERMLIRITALIHLGEGAEVGKISYWVKEQFEQIRDQIHEIRNFLGPLDLKLEGLDYQITRSRLSFELKSLELENQLAQHSTQIDQHSEQIRQIQLLIKMPGIEIPPLTPPKN